MINHNDHTKNQILTAITELKLGMLLRQSNITKSCDVSPLKEFRFLNSKRKEQAVSKNTYYRF